MVSTGSEFKLWFRFDSPFPFLLAFPSGAQQCNMKLSALFEYQWYLSDR